MIQIRYQNRYIFVRSKYPYESKSSCGLFTKDNLAKRNWEGSQRCSFCDHDETIKRLFLDCPLAKILLRSVHIAFNITPPDSIHTLFGTSLNGVDTNSARHIRIGICALLWAIWNCRNDMVFNRQNHTIFLQVIYRATAWIRMWSLLTPAEPGSLWLLCLSCGRW